MSPQRLWPWTTADACGLKPTGESRTSAEETVGALQQLQTSSSLPHLLRQSVSTANPLPKNITQPKSRSASATELSIANNTLAGIHCSLTEQPCSHSERPLAAPCRDEPKIDSILPPHC